MDRREFHLLLLRSGAAVVLAPCVRDTCGVTYDHVWDLERCVCVRCGLTEEEWWKMWRRSDGKIT